MVLRDKRKARVDQGSDEWDEDYRHLEPSGKPRVLQVHRLDGFLRCGRVIEAAQVALHVLRHTRRKPPMPTVRRIARQLGCLLDIKEDFEDKPKVVELFEKLESYLQPPNPLDPEEIRKKIRVNAVRRDRSRRRERRDHPRRQFVHGRSRLDLR